MCDCGGRFQAGHPGDEGKKRSNGRGQWGQNLQRSVYWCDKLLEIYQE